MFKKDKFIKMCKELGIDIIINGSGFKTSYTVYYLNITQRFNSFNDAKTFIEENILRA